MIKKELESILRGFGGINPNALENTSISKDREAAKKFCERLSIMTEDLSKR